MHLTTAEALSLLDMWRAERTVLQIYFSSPSASRELQATVNTIMGTTVKLDALSEEVEVPLAGAEFNGDRRAPPHSKHGAYLVCEFRNDDRWTFQAPRADSVLDQVDRRSQT